MITFRVDRASHYPSFDKEFLKLKKPIDEAYSKLDEEKDWYYWAVDLEWSGLENIINKYGSIIIQKDYLDFQDWLITIYDDYIE